MLQYTLRQNGGIITLLFEIVVLPYFTAKTWIYQSSRICRD